MRRLIQFCSASVLLSLFATAAMADGGYNYVKEDLSGYNNPQPGFKMNDQSDFARDGHAVYFFGGYVYTYRFLSDTTDTIYDPNLGANVSYQPSQALPTSFNGLQIGVGKEWSRHVDLQLSYVQNLSASKSNTTNGVTFSTDVRAGQVITDVAYVINPDDQFQAAVQLGAAITQFNNSLTENASGTNYTVTNNITTVDPAAGLSCLFQMSKSLGVLVDAMYIADVQNQNSSGQVNAMAGLNYIL